jgi:hypothetical protein
MAHMTVRIEGESLLVWLKHYPSCLERSTS